MTVRALPYQLSDAIHHLIECNSANNRDPVRNAAVAAAERATAAFRADVAGALEHPGAAAYKYVGPMVQALWSLRESFDTMTLASSWRGMEAARIASNALRLGTTPAQQRMKNVFDVLTSNLNFYRDEMHLSPMGGDTMRRWALMEHCIQVVQQQQFPSPERFSATLNDALSNARAALLSAHTERALPEGLARKWRTELQAGIEDVIEHYAFERTHGTAATITAEVATTAESAHAETGRSLIAGDAANMPGPDVDAFAGQRDTLTREYETWLTAQKLDLGCAGEALWGRDDLTQAQRAWLSDYVVRWEAMERAEDYARQGLSPCGDSRAESLERVLRIVDDSLTEWRAAERGHFTADGVAARETEWLYWRQRLVAAMGLLDDVPTAALVAATSRDDLIDALQQGQGMAP